MPKKKSVKACAQRFNTSGRAVMRRRSSSVVVTPYLPTDGRGRPAAWDKLLILMRT